MAPTLLVPSTVAHLAPHNYVLVVASLNLLTLLTAFDLGAGVLISSRKSLSSPDAVAAILAGFGLTALPPLLGGMVVSLVPAWRSGIGLADASAGLVWLIVLAAVSRSWLYLSILVAGTLDRRFAQLSSGIASATTALGGTAVAVVAGVPPAVAVTGASLGSSVVGVLAVIVDRPVRTLARRSLGMPYCAAALIGKQARFAAHRSVVRKGASVGFTFSERAIAVAWLTPSGLIAYDLAARMMTMPRQVAAAVRPTLISRFASDDSPLEEAAAVRRLTVLAYVAVLPVVIGSLVVVAPSGQRMPAAATALVLAVGQGALVLTLPTTSWFSARRRVLPEAAMYSASMALLALGLLVMRPRVAHRLRGRGLRRAEPLPTLV